MVFWSLTISPKCDSNLKFIIYVSDWVKNASKPGTSKSIKITGSCSNNSMSLELLTAFSWFSQPSPTALEQYMGLCAIVIIQGRSARFSGLLASYKHKQRYTFCTRKSNWKLSSAMQLKINSIRWHEISCVFEGITPTFPSCAVIIFPS